MQVIAVRRVRDADGATCLNCGTVFTIYTNQTVPWSWRKSQLMHEKGSGHKTQLFAWDNQVTKS